MEAASEAVSEIGQVPGRIRKLQQLKAKMDDIQKKLGVLQKSIQDFEGHGSSAECMSMLEKLENLEDRCEAVCQIMEVQSLRVRVLFVKVFKLNGWFAKNKDRGKV